MDKYCDENVKYRKKKDSSKSKSSSKTKHKHNYEKCVVEYNKYHFVTVRSYCTVCGKLGDTHLDDISVKLPNGSYRILENDEILEKHKKLRRFFVEDTIFDKYVGL